MSIGPLRRLNAAAVALLAVVLAACSQTDALPSPTPVAAADPAVVVTTAGPVRGIVTDDHRLFTGVPYAAPPVGELRWQPPAPVAPWTGLRDATQPGPFCIQDGQPDLGSEDCLTLSVWTPPVDPGVRRPVLVWIHGGGFINGHNDMYDAARLASRGGLVVVAINYRLGAFGFLAHPALGSRGQVGNYGLTDQQAALRWVRDNIGGFGGDPARVTLAGESAGGMSVCDHLVAPASAGLFRAAIIQSGPCQAQADVDDAQRISERYAASVGCPDPGPDSDPESVAACLRALPVSKLATAPWYAHIDTHGLSGPVIGDRVVPVDSIGGFAAGKAVRVPVLIGSNRDEFRLFAAMTLQRTGVALTSQTYPAALARTFGDDAPAVVAAYPPADFGGDTTLAFAAAIGDAVFSCPTEEMVTALADHAPAVYAYEFNDPHAPAPEPLTRVPFPLGATHALEVRYLFGVAGAPPFTPVQQQLADEMVDYWSAFATTGDPNGAGRPRWPAVDAGSAAVQRLSLRPDGSRVDTGFAADHRCEFWAQIGAG